MKISYSNYPSLKLLKVKKLDKLQFHPCDIGLITNKDVLADYVNTWDKYKDKFSSSINYVTKPFAEAVDKSENKLFDLYGDILTNDISDFKVNGTFIKNGIVRMIHYDTKKGSEDFRLVFYAFDQFGAPLVFYKHSNLDAQEFGWISKSLKFNHDDKTQISKLLYRSFMEVVVLDMFKKFSQVEIRTFGAKSKTKEFNCKYVNDTDFKINHLDSTWYTTLVKSDSFKVNGHLRWQPKKVDGEWTKELIWIEDFTKSGYTRKAAKLVSE